jgi:hypothetical protein
MSWWKDLAAIFQSIGTLAVAIFAGAWALWRFQLRQERFPHIETSADIQVIGEHGDNWIIELIAYMENKGTAQHRMTLFDFDLSSLEASDAVLDADRYGGQVLFPHTIKKGSFLREGADYYFIDPGIKSKYSYVTKASKSASFLIFHYWFNYDDREHRSHAAERTIKLPNKGM